MRTFEFRSGTSAKFWSIDVKGSTVTTRWGRIGTKGQEKVTTHARPGLARNDANKQMAKKLAEDYRETGAKTKPVVLPAPKSVSKKKLAVSKVKPARTRKPAVAKTPVSTKAIDELFARGYPHLRRLAPAMGRGVVAATKRALDATDPIFGVDVPADLAEGFVTAMMFSRELTEARKVSGRLSGDVDTLLLRNVLDRLRTDDDESPQCVREGVWLFEAFLGTEVVAEKVVAHLVDIAKHTPADHAFALVDALGYMRWRMPSVRWTAITRPLQAIKKEGLFAERLRLLVDPMRPIPASLRDRAVEIALQRGDAATLRTLYNGRAYWDSARFAYLVGGEHFDHIDYDELNRLPEPVQRRVVAEYGLLHGPHIERIMGVLTARSGKK